MRPILSAVVFVGCLTLGACSSGSPDAGSVSTSQSGTSTAITTTTTSAATTTTAAPETSTTSPSTTTTVDIDALVPSGFFEYASGEAVFGAAPYLDFSVATESGTGIDPAELAAFVDETLADRRSWIGDEATGLRRVPEGGAFTIVVATPPTVDQRCQPLQTNGIYSCARNGFVMLNLRRWLTATDDWPADLTTYRRYLVNHEVGHYLRGPAHDSCPGPGELAPVMMQQTKGLDGCVANGWVFPEP